jgi:hypothetical protein
MKINWKWAWAEASMLGAALYAFEKPSLLAYATAHPGSTIAALITIIVGMGIKPSSLQKTA